MVQALRGEEPLEDVRRPVRRMRRVGYVRVREVLRIVVPVIVVPVIVAEGDIHHQCQRDGRQGSKRLVLHVMSPQVVLRT